MEPSRKFTVFPNLSLEMRRMIWTSSFESKEVGLDIYPLWEEHPELDPNWSVQPPRLFPASLWVNIESRAETLRHYSIVSLSDVFEKYQGLPPICVNFALDSVVLSNILALDAPRFSATDRPGDRQGMNNSWLTHLSSVSNDRFRRVQYLEVKEMHWGHSYNNVAAILQRYRYEVENEQMPPGSMGRPLLLPVLESIKRFTGLKILCLTWLSTCPITESPEEALTLEDCRKHMQEFVDRHNDSYVGGRAPEVQVRYWNKIMRRYVYAAPEVEKFEEEI